MSREATKKRSDRDEGQVDEGVFFAASNLRVTILARRSSGSWLLAPGFFPLGNATCNRCNCNGLVKNLMRLVALNQKEMGLTQRREGAEKSLSFAPWRLCVRLR